MCTGNTMNQHGLIVIKNKRKNQNYLSIKYKTNN